MVTQVIIDCYENMTDMVAIKRIINFHCQQLPMKPISLPVCFYFFSQAMSIYKKLDHTVPHPSLKDEAKNEEGL